MGFQSAIQLDRTIGAARETATSMRSAAEANPSAKSAEVPMPAFLHIAELLDTLSARLDHATIGRSRVVGGACTLGLDALAGILSAVPTMGGESLAELLAPSEIREIAEAALAAMEQTSTPPEQAAAPPGNDLLEHLFARYQ